MSQLPSKTTTESWARWCFETCLLFGCDPATSARVAALFTDAIEKGTHRGLRA
jgi:hypothetical protein